MDLDSVPIAALFALTVMIVIVSIEGGYRLGRIFHRRSKQEKESPVSAVAGAVLALVAFMLAFTFGIAANRFDARKELVREEANNIRIAWQRSDFLPKPDRDEAKSLIRQYLVDRVAVFQSGESERIKDVLSRAEQIQGRLWKQAVANAGKDMNSNVGTLYIESLNDLSAIHASRVAVGLQMRIPSGIWIVLLALTILGMIAMGYEVGIAGSERTLVMPILAVAFASVITIIGSLDRPIGGFTTVSQQPLADLLSSIDTVSR